MIKMYKQEGNIKRGKLKQEQIKEFQNKILNEIDLFSIYKNKITGNYTTPFLERFRNIYRTTLIYDYDKTNLIGNVIDGIFDKVYLYFSLVKIVDPKRMHSFSITIINNAKLNIETYLGDLEQRNGPEIKYANHFEVEYFFQREQILIIQPKIKLKK